MGTLDADKDAAKERVATTQVLSRLAGCMGPSGRLLESHVLRRGLIHDTYVAAYEADGRIRRYLHQRLNTQVFRDPEALMANIARVTAHLRAKLEEQGCTDVDRRVLTLVPARDGRSYCLDGAGAYWRTYHYIEGARAHDTIETPELAFQAAQAFGRFVCALAELPGPRLYETIPHFHDTPARFQALLDAVRQDPCRRAAAARAEIDLAVDREPLAGVLARLQSTGDLAERVAHNDTKISNVLFDALTGDALCVVDLDTVMPGLILHNVGDLIRTAAAAAPEGECAASFPALRLPVFEAVVRGYVAGAGTGLTEQEVMLFPVAATVVTLESGRAS